MIFTRHTHRECIVEGTIDGHAQEANIQRQISQVLKSARPKKH